MKSFPLFNWCDLRNILSVVIPFILFYFRCLLPLDWQEWCQTPLRRIKQITVAVVSWIGRPTLPQFFILTIIKLCFVYQFDNFSNESIMWFFDEKFYKSTNQNVPGIKSLVQIITKHKLYQHSYALFAQISRDASKVVARHFSGDYNSLIMHRWWRVRNVNS